MSDLSFVAGSTTAPSVFGTITANGQPVNISSATVRFLMRNVLDRRFVVDGVATVVDGAAGTVRYDWADGDLDQYPGSYVSRWQVVNGDTTIEYTDPSNTITINAV